MVLSEYGGSVGESKERGELSLEMRQNATGITQNNIHRRNHVQNFLILVHTHTHPHSALRNKLRYL